MRGLGLGFTNPVGTGAVWDCVLVAAVCVVSDEWLGAFMRNSASHPTGPHG